MQLLRDNPLLLFFLVAALGQLIGNLRIAGFGFGVAAVLFVGLAFGAQDPSLRLPDFVSTFGLTLFVYTMGLSSGPSFFASFRKKALRDNLLVLVTLLVAAALTLLLSKGLRLSASEAAGLFAGSLTNTPSLAGILDALASVGADQKTLAAPVVSYSIAYPGGVFVMLLAVALCFRSKAASPREMRTALLSSDEHLETWVIRVTQPAVIGCSLLDVKLREHLKVSFARLKRGDHLLIATPHSTLQAGDFLSIVGQHAHLEHAMTKIGERTSIRLDEDRSSIDFRRIFVSRKALTEIALSRLALGSKFGAAITRIRRGDIEIIPDQKTHLELGDRVRVVAPRERMDEISTFFGDSYRALSEIDVLTFSLGIALGLLLGRIPIPLPGQSHLELGAAGGPLLVGLVLGRLGRTGPFVWTLPFSANLTLRQLGMILFLAGVGTRSGSAFAATLQSGENVWTFVLGGAAVTLIVAMILLAVGRLFKIQATQLAGILAAAQTQPAVLGYATEKAGNEQANLAYATVYPLAMIVKIILGQLILQLW